MLRCDDAEESEVIGFDFRNFQPSLLTLYPTNAIAIQIPEDEREHYCSLCKNGTLYDFMLKETTSYPTRSDLKREFNKMLNEKNHRMKWLEVWEVFNRYFPSYSLLMQEIKRTDHTKMATFLQQMESKIVFGDVIKRFDELTHERSPFFTCHDSIYTIKQSKNLLRQAMVDTIQEVKIPTTIVQEGSNPITCNRPSTYATMNQLNLRLSL